MIIQARVVLLTGLDKLPPKKRHDGTSFAVAARLSEVRRRRRDLRCYIQTNREEYERRSPQNKHSTR